MVYSIAVVVAAAQLWTNIENIFHYMRKIEQEEQDSWYKRDLPAREESKGDWKDSIYSFD